DRTLIRIASEILILFGGLSLWVYIILWILIPKAPAQLNP
ncbi:MAG: PspC domain-containing protein, partial [Alistipes sp.]|nr:PspC domain-containing protein [Alistipes sp.]